MMFLADTDENAHFADEDTVAWRHSGADQGPTAGGQWRKSGVLLSMQGNQQHAVKSFTSTLCRWKSPRGKLDFNCMLENCVGSLLAWFFSLILGILCHSWPLSP